MVRMHTSRSTNKKVQSCCKFKWFNYKARRNASMHLHWTNSKAPTDDEEAPTSSFDLKFVLFLSIMSDTNN